MSQNKRVMNLFGFLMDLLDEQNTTKENVTSDVTKKEEEVVDELSPFIHKLRHPTLPPHPESNPIIKVKNKLTTIAPHSISLINKMGELDQERAKDLMKSRIVTQVTKPLLSEIENLKKEANDGALENKIKEETEYLNDDTVALEPNRGGLMVPEGERVGLTRETEDGILKPVSIPSELRDKIPVDTSDLKPISKDMQEYLETLINKPTSDMPKDIKDAMMEAPSIIVGVGNPDDIKRGSKPLEN